MENPECTNWLEDERKRLERKRLEELNSNLPSGSRISDVPPEVVPITLNQLCTGEEMGGRGGCHGDSGEPKDNSSLCQDILQEGLSQSRRCPTCWQGWSLVGVGCVDSLGDLASTPG